MTTIATMRALDETRGAVEAWLMEEGSRTRLVVEQRGLPTGHLPFHASGWRVHLEDLARSLEVDGPVHPEGWSHDAGCLTLLRAGAGSASC